MRAPGTISAPSRRLLRHTLLRPTAPATTSGPSASRLGRDRSSLDFLLPAWHDGSCPLFPRKRTSGTTGDASLPAVELNSSRANRHQLRPFLPDHAKHPREMSWRV